MRLICPNCSAQYEVAQDAIPESGRDVQCANCGDTWFQERTEEAAPPPPPAARPTPESPPVARDNLLAEDADEDEADLDADYDDDDDEYSYDDEEDGPTPLGAAKVQTDPSVLDILRREAEREAAQRAAEAEAEAKGTAPPAAEEVAEPDDAEQEAIAAAIASRAAPTPRPNRERRINFVETPEAETEAQEDMAQATEAPASSRRPRGRDAAQSLPDIEELNSTLLSSKNRPQAAPVEPAKAAAPRRARIMNANRVGFYLAIAIVLALIALYLRADQLAQSMPAAKPYLAQFVHLADQARMGIAKAFAALLELLKNILAQIL